MPDDLTGGLTMQVSRSVRWESPYNFCCGSAWTLYRMQRRGVPVMKAHAKSGADLQRADTDSLKTACNSFQETNI